LSAIHSAGVIHRDLKPSNVVLSPLGPRVIDFGIAQLAGTLSVASQAVIGTPAFMAPEQAQGRPVSAASDVFSWGGLLVYAGTGRLPFGGGSAPEVMYRIVHEAPDLDGLDARLSGIVERALAKDPALRPSAQELLNELVGGSPATASQVVESTWTQEPPPPPEEPPRQPPAESQPREPTRPPEPPVVTLVKERLAVPWRSWREGLAAALARRRALVGLAAAAVAVGAAVVLFLAMRPGSLPYRANFADPASGWARGSSAGGSFGYDAGTYRLGVHSGWQLWKSAPTSSRHLDAVEVTAVARPSADNEAEFGVWCRGDPSRGDTERYDFRVKAGGEASITKERRGSESQPLSTSSVSAPTQSGADYRIRALCRGVGGKVELRLWVNDVELVSVSDAQGPYGPGEVGVYGGAGPSRAVEVRYLSFEARSAPPA
jgi:outer membrane biosynthesis protein TonB